MERLLKKILMVALFTMVMIPLIATAEEIHIPDDFDTIQGGINAARNGDVVLVAPGEYEENVDFNEKSISVIGDVDRPEDVIITGSRNGRSVVVFRDILDGAVLRGFTITNGQSDFGSGIYCNNAVVTLSNLIITENVLSDNGGGLYCTQNSTVDISDSIIRDNEAVSGAGISCYNASTITIEDCAIEHNNAARYGGGLQCSRDQSVMFVSDSRVAFNHAGYYGGGLFAYGADGEVPEFTLRNVEFIANTSERDGGGIVAEDAIGSLERVVMYQNICGALIGYGAQLDVRHCTFCSNTPNIQHRRIINSTGSLDFSNSIFNEFGEELLGAFGENTFEYNDIRGGQDMVLGEYEWLDGNFDEDPMFVDIENGDLHLTADSPCINAGDPNGERDADGTVADVGVYTFLFTCTVFGAVRDAETFDPLEDVSVTISNGLQTNTDAAGEYNIVSWSGIFDVTFSVPGYNDFVAEDVELPFFGEVEVNADMVHPIFLCSHDNIDVSVDSAANENQSITIRNPGNGSLQWSLKYHFDGEEGYDPWELRRSIPVEEITDDSQIEGVAFADNLFFAYGSNAGEPSIYIITLDGELINSFPAPRDNDNRLVSNLAWDGELLWASGCGTIFGFNLHGDIVHQWEGPYDINSRLAYDNERDLLWVGYTTQDIIGYNRDGERIATIPRSDTRITALAYYPEDPDGCTLYVGHTIRDSSHTTISKVNPDNGEFLIVHDLVNMEDEYYKGCFLTNEYDRFNGWVLMAVSNTSDDDGGDRIDIYQLARNLFFVSPDESEGIVDANGEQSIRLVFNTVNDEGYTLPVGDYAGELVFTHNAIGGQTRVPLTISVVIPSDIVANQQILPIKATLHSAYPNPFNSTTTIGYSLPAAGNVSVAVYDLSGREVARLVDGEQLAGNHEIVWTADGIASGVYMVKLDAGGVVAREKVVLVK